MVKYLTAAEPAQFEKETEMPDTDTDTAATENVVDRGAVVKTRKVAKPKAAAKVKSAAKPKAAVKSKDKAAAKAASESDIFDREKYQYEARTEKTAGGRRSVNSGDRLALALMGKPAAAIRKMLKPNGLEDGNWDHLNEGMQKMNATNKLRALIKSGGKVTIDGKVIASLGK